MREESIDGDGFTFSRRRGEGRKVPRVRVGTVYGAKFSGEALPGRWVRSFPTPGEQRQFDSRSDSVVRVRMWESFLLEMSRRRACSREM